MSRTPPSAPSEPIHVLTLNAWGLKYISTHRHARLLEIGRRLATHNPPLSIICLQECWTYTDYAAIRDQLQSQLPHAKFYNSGIFGGGLAIFSKWPIVESSMYRYSLNGRPTAFFRGDWFVGKGVAHAKLRLPSVNGETEGMVIEVFNTHLHAPYEKEPNDSYICHRTAQAWEIAKMMKAAGQRGSLVLGMGDFNMVPLSFAHVLIETRGDVRDMWRVLRPESSVGASEDLAEKERRRKTGEKETPTVSESLDTHGHTCDSVMNTWRWNKAHKKALQKGNDRKIESADDDPRAKRLDYIFFNGLGSGWKVSNVKVSMTERHPKLLCSLSDHFAVEATISRSQTPPETEQYVEVAAPLHPSHARKASESIVEFENNRDFESVMSGQRTKFHLDHSFYEEILKMIDQYARRERKQRRYRTSHFVGSAFISIGSFVAIWWSPKNYVSFIILLISTFGIMAGTVDGLIGGLFVGSELRALSEFEWEVRNALQLAGGPKHEDQALKDWYD